MLVSELQRILLSHLRQAQAHVLKTTVYSLSDEPDDPAIISGVDQPTVVADVIMSRTAFFQMRDQLRTVGVRVTYRWKELEGSDKTFYEIAARPRTP